MTKKLRKFIFPRKILPFLGAFVVCIWQFSSGWATDLESTTEWHFSGPVIQKGKKFETLSVTGPVKLFECAVNGDVKIVGSANFKQCVFEGNCKVNGNTKVCHSTFQEKVKVNGSIKLENCTFKNNCKINGKGELSDSAFEGKTKFNGGKSIQRCIFKENCKFNGRVNVFQSEFKNSVKINGNSTISSSHLEKEVLLGEGVFVFNNCKVDSIQLEQPRPLETQTIELNQGTIIYRSIVFESGKGEVILREGSEIKGEVIGGKVVKK